MDLGIPNLTPRAWYEAKFGRKAWERIQKISPRVWQDYLDWYREVLELPVENNTEVISIGPADNLLVAELRRQGEVECVLARKVVLATGLDGSGGWRVHPLVADLSPQRYAHASDAIDFGRCAGKRVAVLGAGASAFDNAAAALEAGAAAVDLYLRRAEIPRVNPLFWTNFAAMLGHFAELTDVERWRLMRHILEELPMPPPQDSFWRCRRSKNFRWHSNCVWRSVRTDDDTALVETNAGTFACDFIILCHRCRNQSFGKVRACPNRSANCTLAGPFYAAGWRGERSAGWISLPWDGIRIHGTRARRGPLPAPASQLHLWSDPEPWNNGSGDHRPEVWCAATGQWLGAGPVPGGCRQILSRASCL